MCKVKTKVIVGLIFTIISGLSFTGYANVPEITFGEASLVSPSSANTYYGSSTTHSVATWSANREPELKAIARALKYDANLIYQYVHDKINIEPTYGLQKGALGASIDGYGTAFDQAHLMVELLKESDLADSKGYSPQYKAGTITITEAQAANWFGLSDSRGTFSSIALQNLFARGGIPASFSGGSVTLSHIWVSATVNGQRVVFDPSLKTHDIIDGIDLKAAMGFNSSSFNSNATSSMTQTTENGVNVISGVSNSSLNSSLNTYAATLLEKLRTEYSDSDMMDIVGGNIIKEVTLPTNGVSQTALPYSSTALHTWNNIPNQYRTKLKVGVKNRTHTSVYIDKTLYVDEIYGRALQLSPYDALNLSNGYDINNIGKNGFVDKVFLMLDNTVIASYEQDTSTSGSEVSYAIELSVDHVYASVGTSGEGTYMDKVFYRPYVDLVLPVTIANSFGTVSSKLVTKLHREFSAHDTIGQGSLSQAISDGNDDLDADLQTNTKAKVQLGYSWLAQFSRMSMLQADVGKVRDVQHHSIGLVSTQVDVVNFSGGGGAPATFIGNQAIRLDMESGLSVVSETANNNSELAIKHSISAAASTLEGSVFEQERDIVDVASTSERFSWAASFSDSRNKFNLFTPNDVGKVNSLMTTQGNPVSETDPNNPFYISSLNVLPFIKNYLNNGYNVIAGADTLLGPGVPVGPALPNRNNPSVALSSMEVGGAFIAYKPNGNGIAHIVVSSDGGYKGGGGAIPTKPEEQYAPSMAADILKDTFEDRSIVHGVDLSSGSATYSTGSLLSTGSGGFPYQLDYSVQLRNNPSQRSEKEIDGNGHHSPIFRNNLQTELSTSGSALEAMGETSPLRAVASLVSFTASQSMLENNTSFKSLLAQPMINDWWSEHLTYNMVSVTTGFTADQYFRLVDGSFHAPNGRSSVLTQTGSRAIQFDILRDNTRLYRYSDNEKYKLELEDGSTQSFSYGGYSDSSTTTSRYVMTEWKQPSGFKVNYKYGYDDTPVSAHNYTLLEVSNDLNRKLTYKRDGATRTITDDGDRVLTLGSTITLPEGLQYQFKRTTGTWYNGTTSNGDNLASVHRPLAGYLLNEIYLPGDTSNPSLKYFYDENLQVYQVKDAMALQTGGDNRDAYNFHIVPSHRGERVDPLGNSYSVNYDYKGRAKKHTDEVGDSVITAYDGLDRVVERTYPEGNKTIFEYDSHSNVKKITKTPKPDSDENTLIASALYHPTYNKPIEVTDYRGNKTKIEYYTSGGGAGQVKYAERPSVDGDKPRIDFTYNDIGQPLTILEKVNGSETRTTKHVYYTPSHNLYKGGLHHTTIDDGGLSLKTSYTYTQYGDVHRVTTPKVSGINSELDVVTTYTYDNLRRQKTITDAKGNVTEYFYNNQGLVDATKRSIDNTWQTISYTYWPNRYKKTITDPQGFVTNYSYDYLDRLDIVTDAEGRKTKSDYYADGELHKTIKAYQSTQKYADGSSLQQDYQTYTYTANGNIASVADANGNKTNYDYDGHDRLKSITFPDGSTEQYTSYDNNGNLLTKVTRANQTIRQTFDTLNRITSKSPANQPSITYKYNLVGQPTETKDSNNYIITYSYDTAGRNDSVTDNGRTLGYEYDSAGNRTKITWPDDFKVTYFYDELNRVTGIGEGDSTRTENVTKEVCSDESGEIECEDVVVGQIEVFDGIILANYEYDSLSRRKTLTLGNGAATTFSYETDNALDTLSHTFNNSNANVSWLYDYNRVNQQIFKSLDNNTYQHQKPNSQNDVYQSNTLNQYTRVGGATLSYDLNGNLKSDGTWTYTYDTENRLKTANKAGISTSNTYDPLGRRSSKTVNSTTTTFLSDGSEQIADYSGNTLLRRYVHGPNVDEPVVMYTGAGTTNKQYYHSDIRGSVVAMSNSVGNMIEQYTYSPFGIPDQVSGNPFRYTGQRYDAETGLYYYKARMYHPGIGRFMQVDPIGYDDNMNLYGYVANDPMNAKDPTGEFLQTLIGGGVGAVVNVGLSVIAGNTSTEQLLGAAAGGFTTGALVANGAPLTVANAIGGSVGNAVEQFANVATGKQESVSGGQVATSGLVSAAVGKIPTLPVAKVTTQRGNMGAVFKAQMTNLARGNTKNVSSKTIAKGTTAGIVGGSTQGVTQGLISESKAVETIGNKVDDAVNKTSCEVLAAKC